MSLLIIIGYIAAGILFIFKINYVAIIVLVAAIILHIFRMFSTSTRAVTPLLKAKQAIGQGDIERAVKLVLDSIALNADENNVNYILDQPGKNTEHYLKLAFILENKLKANDTPFFRYFVSSIFYNVGNTEKVVEIMKEIPEKDLSLKNVRILGAAFMELKEFKEALALFEKFEPEKAPFSSDGMAILLGIGQSNAETKNIKKAKEYYTRIAQSNSNFPGLSILGDRIKEIEK